jgi:CubicO group peptidase (beta-lactamase class C family)
MLLGIALLCSSCKTYSSRDVSDAAACAMRLERGRSVEAEAAWLARPLIDSGNVYGMAIGVLTPDGRTQSFGFGRTGLPGDASPPRADTIFEVGSVSKLCVTTLLPALVKEGRISYQDTVRSILPPEVPVSAAVGQLTLYELVTHTGGFSRQPNNAIQGRYFINYLFTGKDLYGYITKPYLYEYLRTCRLPSKATRHYIYSNIGMALLAHLIEQKTGQTLPALIEEKICRPLNMRDTGFALSAEQRSRLAVGHVGDQPKFMRRGAPMAAWDMGEIMRAAGGLYSTVNDLLTFAKANLGFVDQPLAPILASTHQAQLKTPSQDVALGWLINYFDDGRLSVLHLHGMVSGYMAYIGLDVEDQVRWSCSATHSIGTTRWGRTSSWVLLARSSQAAMRCTSVRNTGGPCGVARTVQQRFNERLHELTRSPRLLVPQTIAFLFAGKTTEFDVFPLPSSRRTPNTARKSNGKKVNSHTITSERVDSN